MTADELAAAIEAEIGALAIEYRGGATESDLYEAALLATAVTAAEAVGGRSLLTQDGITPALANLFRRGPGNLWLGNFTYARVDFLTSSRDLEVHLGVRVLGRSGVAHECDVAIIDGEEARRSRLGGVHPRHVGLIAAIEAKHYASSPGIGIGRAFLGLGVELGNHKCSLAFPASTSQTLWTLLSKKQCECFDELLPGTSSDRRLQALLEQAIKNWAR